MESLSKYKIANSENALSLIVGGVEEKTGGTSTAPQTTMTANISCSDSAVYYDDDKGKSSGHCISYNCA